MQPLLVLGAMALLHAAYSSYEWVSVHKLLGALPPQRVPRDVLVEAIVGLALVVLSATGAGVASMLPERIATSNALKTTEGQEPFAYLETRPNFQDLVARRQEYLRWRKDQAAAPGADAAPSATLSTAS